MGTHTHMPKHIPWYRLGLVAVALFFSPLFGADLKKLREKYRGDGVGVTTQTTKAPRSPSPTPAPSSILTSEPTSLPTTSPTSNTLRLGPIFYNVYIPNDGNQKTLDHATSVTQEQMMQRNWSSTDIGGDTSLLLYTLIGYPNVTNDFCQPNCFQRQYLPNGDEVDTLQALYEHCQQNPRDIVTYIHDKGSYHNNPHNTKTRRMATKAAFDCRKALLLDDQLATQFNVCAGHFLVLPQYLATANMWTAKCSYVRFLLPPKQYEVTMQRMYNETIFHPQKGKTEYACLRPLSLEPNHLGLGRYAYERWVWSHPDVEPAEIVPYGKTFDFSKFPQEWSPVLGRAAKAGPKWFGMGGGKFISSFARLEGRLFEWEYLYHQKPSNSSWIWRYYQGFETGSAEFKAHHCPNTG